MVLTRNSRWRRLAVAPPVLQEIASCCRYTQLSSERSHIFKCSAQFKCKVFVGIHLSILEPL